MHLRTLLVAAATALLPSFAAAYANPGACSGACGNAHDPAIVRRDDGTYFRFSTGGKIAVHTAPSIQGPWTYKGAAIPRGSTISLKGRDDLWAPDVKKVGNLYYLLYSVSSFGVQSSAVGYATSSTLDVGSWTDRGSTGITSRQGSQYNAIDGNIVVDGNSASMAFGSFWSGLFSAGISVGGGAIKKTGRDVQIGFQPSGEHATEAAFVYKNGGKWFLFFSEGSCCNLDKKRPRSGSEYRIKVCRSTGGATGPFVDQTGKSCTQGGGTTVLPSHGWVYAPGGQGVYDDPQLGPVLYYHYVDTRIGYADGDKKFGWNKIDFSSGWPVV